MRCLTTEQLDAALAVRDLTDPSAGPHAMHLMLDEIVAALAAAWCRPVPVHRGPRVVAVADNYDRLRYPPDAVTRDSRYSRYVTGRRMLRAHTTAHVPDLLAGMDGRPELAVACPGVCYRRDRIDRLHVGEPHQLDVWRVRARGRTLGEDDLVTMIGTVVGAALPALPPGGWRTVPSPHSYTHGGRQIDVHDGRDWVEVGECGLAHREVLAAAGLPPGACGLAMGLGLDRLLMLRKGIDDVRLLRATDERVAGQLVDLTPYRPVSALPAVRRDLSIAVGPDVDDELLGDRVREALAGDASAVESVELLSQTPYDALPEAARRRIGMRPGQRNVLVRVVLRPLERTLTADEANELRDRVYAALHEGTTHQWTRCTTEPGHDR